VTTTPHGNPECTPIIGEALRRIEEAIRLAVPDDEIMVHFDVLVETRHGPGARLIRYRRLAPPGSDPLLSLGLLTAATGRLRRRLGMSDE
jgi:hypothetical protein